MRAFCLKFSYKDRRDRNFAGKLTHLHKHINEIADEFLKRYPGDKEAALASARYPRIEFTFTETERKIAEAEMDMLVEMGELPRKISIPSVFVT